MVWLMRWVSARTNTTCPYCLSQHGKIYRSDQPMPKIPVHIGCQCYYELYGVLNDDGTEFTEDAPPPAPPPQVQPQQPMGQPPEPGQPNPQPAPVPAPAIPKPKPPPAQAPTIPVPAPQTPPQAPDPWLPPVWPIPFWTEPRRDDEKDQGGFG